MREDFRSASLRASAVAITILVSAGLLSGCGSGHSSINAPGIAPSPASPAPAGTTSIQLNGYVYDTGFRPIAGATVEVLDGPQAGMVLTSQADGHLSAIGGFNGVTMRATMAGYAPATEPVHLTNAGGWIYFDLVSLTPPVPLASKYTLTIAADSSCTALPEELRTRTYSTTVTPGGTANAPSNTWFGGYVTDAQMAGSGNGFFIGVSGDYVGFSTNGEGPSLVEVLGNNRYLAYAIDARFPGVVPGASTMSASFTGMIEYCELPGPIAYYDCSRNYNRREQCTGTNGRVTLTAR